MGSYINDVRFWGGLGGSSKIGQNRTRGVGSLSKIGHPIILVLSQKQIQKRIYPNVHCLLSLTLKISKS